MKLKNVRLSLANVARTTNSKTMPVNETGTIKKRLEDMLKEENAKQLTIEDLADELDIDMLDEIDDDEQTSNISIDAIDVDKLRAEIDIIDGFIDKALKIKYDSKSDALLTALINAFEILPTIGARNKALIFTESTRTQNYLKDFLEKNGYKGKIILFNGSNNDPESNTIYNTWCQRNAFNGKVSGIKAADKRASLVEYFRDSAEIMIATEAAAEGLNLQFCSLVVNYDLPWNPQRIEQRIGRCHRYGQKSDVVVVNFVNKRNYADVRVYNLLLDKFHLFDDVFGASDEVLGRADELDFERRIWEIYQECRTEEEINVAFERLQSALQEQIDERLNDVKEQVLENFDIGVQERLKLAKSEAGAFLNRYEHIFWELTKYVLEKDADFDDKTHSFTLKNSVYGCRLGKYQLPSCVTDGIAYRLSDPLAQYVINTALALELDMGTILFDKSKTNITVSLPEYLRGASGYMVLSSLSVKGIDEEEYSLFTAFTSDGRFLPQEDAEKLFLLGGEETDIIPLSDELRKKLFANQKQHAKSKIQDIDTRNMVYFNEEEERIFRWEKDLIGSIEKELDVVKKSIREHERLSRHASNLDEKLAITKKIEELERQKRKKRNELADREDEVGERRRVMIAELDKKRIQSTATSDIFVISWSVL